MTKIIPNNPRGHAQTVPFQPELGEVDGLQGSEESGSFTTDYGGEWQPISARDKRPTKNAIYDNMEVPGSAYPGRDRGQAWGAPWNGMGETPTRNTDGQTCFDNQENWDEDKRDVSLTSPFQQEYSRNPDMGNQDTLEIMEQFNANGNEKSKVFIKENKMDFKKITAASKARLEQVYSIEEDYATYGRYCGEPTCVGVWKELLGFDQKRAMKIERDSEVWRCPKCKRITEATGSISEQTSGPAAYDTYNSGQPATEENFTPVNKIKPDPNRQLR